MRSGQGSRKVPARRQGGEDRGLVEEETGWSQFRRCRRIRQSRKEKGLLFLSQGGANHRRKVWEEDQKRSPFQVIEKTERLSKE